MNESNYHCFYRNNELAGEAAVMHAYLCWGRMPANTTVAVLGRGNVAKGAIKVLHKLGANIVVYNRNQEQLFRDESPRYDVIVNAVLWDKTRKDHILSRLDVKRLKPRAFIIDVSCDEHGAIETTIPTTIDNPIYIDEGVLHYALDHTPSLLYQDASESISGVVSNYLDDLILSKNNRVLSDSIV